MSGEAKLNKAMKCKARDGAARREVSVKTAIRADRQDMPAPSVRIRACSAAGGIMAMQSPNVRLPDAAFSAMAKAIQKAAASLKRPKRANANMYRRCATCRARRRPKAGACGLRNPQRLIAGAAQSASSGALRLLPRSGIFSTGPIHAMRGALLKSVARGPSAVHEPKVNVRHRVVIAHRIVNGANARRVMNPDHHVAKPGRRLVKPVRPGVTDDLKESHASRANRNVRATITMLANRLKARSLIVSARHLTAR